VNKKQARNLERRKNKRKTIEETRVERRTRLYQRLLSVVKAESDVDAGVDALIMVLVALVGSIAARTGHNTLAEIHSRIDAAAGVAEIEVRKALGTIEELSPPPVIARVPWWRRLTSWIMRGLR
jgi:hypothetical protein